MTTFPAQKNLLIIRVIHFFNTATKTVCQIVPLISTEKN